VTFIALLVVLFVVAATRVLDAASVFRRGDVVLPGNDPYFYRVTVERLLARGGTPFDISGNPAQVETGEPLLVATLWAVSALFGGSSEAVGLTVALYPVAAAVASAGLVYALGTRLAGDRWSGVAAAVALALVPAFARRTRLGFADHHAFDYVWLLVTALSLVVLVTGRERRDRRGVLAALGVGVGVAGQLLSWDAGALLVLPLAPYAVLQTTVDVRDDRAPTDWGLPLAGGLTAGTLLVGGAHLAFGWQETVVTFVPASLAVGTLLVVVLGEAVRRRTDSVATLVAAEAVGVCGVLLAGSTVFRRPLERNAGRLFNSKAISEALPLFHGSAFWGTVVNFGALVFVAAPFLVAETWRSLRRSRPGWLAASTYAWCLFGLTLVQVRFAGEFAPFVALFTGVGVVRLVTGATGDVPPAGVSDAPSPSAVPAAGDSSRAEPEAAAGGPTPTASPDGPRRTPTRRDVLTALSFGGVVAGTSLVDLPYTVATTTDAKHDAATWMRRHATEQGWEYPRNYVLSQWGDTRLYNYFVNGRARSYWFAASNFTGGVASEPPAEWYDRFDGRVGFVVVGRDDWGPLYERLYRNDGDGLSHFRLGYVSTDASLKVFTLVPGAVLTGRLDESEPAVVETSVALDNWTTTYTQRIATDEARAFEATVPYAGTYDVGDGTVTVTPADVRNGRTVELDG
jgi:dolichyl-diphosphooligosaccharide--protein glycosyltransferase